MTIQGGALEDRISVTIDLRVDHRSGFVLADSGRWLVQLGCDDYFILAAQGDFDDVAEPDPVEFARTIVGTAIIAYAEHPLVVDGQLEAPFD